MATLSLPQLSLDLPGNSTRFSVDFGTLTIDLGVLSTPVLVSSNAGYLNNGKNKPLPPLHQPVQKRQIPYQNPLSNVTEEVEIVSRIRSQQSKGQRRRVIADRSKPPAQPAASLKKTYSNASTVSTSSTYAKSIFSRAQSSSTERSSITSSNRPSIALRRPKKDLPTLSSLPLSLLEHILSYVLYLPQTVSVGPTSSAQMQYQYHREALDHIDLRQVLKHPIFLVSQHIRDVARDVLYRKCEFTIDLSGIYYTKVSSTVNDNLKKHQKFWNEPPKIVRDTLSNLLRLHIRLPVPSTSTAGRRGRYEDNWMDGSDGKGGGNWRLRSMEKEQEDAQRVQKCLEVIVQLVATAGSNTKEPRGLTRSLSSLGSARRSSSRPKLERSKSLEYNRSRRGMSDIKAEDGKRKPLKRLEIVLVKRSSQAHVLPEALGLIRTMRGISVIGYTRYYFELQGHKLLWATKYKRQWQGVEPDGSRLLQDLQSLSVAQKPIEPIQTPTEFKFAQVGKKTKQSQPKGTQPEDKILELPTTIHSLKSTRRKPLAGMFSKKDHKRNDSFGFIADKGMSELGSSGTVTSGRYEPPTVEELRKIVEDVRAGIY